MDQNNDSGRRDSENRGPITGGFAWYLVATGVAFLFLVLFIFHQAGHRMDFTDFEKLVHQCRLKKTSEEAQRLGEKPQRELGDDNAYLIIKEGHKKVRYWDLQDVVIHETRITANVSREITERKDKPVTSENEKHTKQDVSIYVHKSDNQESEQRLIDILKASNIGFAYAKGPDFLTNYGFMLLMFALLLLFFFMMMRRIGGAGSPMAFGRSRGRMYAQEDLGVTFDDAAGIEEAVEEVREVVDFLQSPEKYQRLGGRIPKGVLLVGPPGTGKTLLAKAIAGEASVPFFSLSGSDFVEMFVGVGAARVRDMFRQAEAKAPCIIFIDELDALGKTRGTSVVGGHDEREQTLNALLVEMDGFDSNNGVIVMAATNRPEMLDPALLRPGRFDRNVLVDRPDVKGREEILKVHVKNVKLDLTVDLKQVASICSGFAGADLANLVNEAALLAARQEKNSVSLNEFNEAVERVTAGLEKKQRVMNEDEKQRVAYHESGHALVAFSLPNTDPVHKVSIIPRGIAALGYTMQRPEGDRFLLTQAELESRIQVLLAGTIAEEIIFEDISTGSQNDLERATEIARAMVTQYGMSRMGRVNFRETSSNAFLPGISDDRSRSYSEQTAHEIDGEVNRIMREGIEHVRHILEARRGTLQALAVQLIEHETIDADKLKQIMDENSHGPLIVPGTVGALKRSVLDGAVDVADDDTAESGA